MKLIGIFLFSIVMTAGLLSNPVFVNAGSTCYVDEDANDDGNGSKNEPYQDIEETLYKDCDKIIIEKGIYKDDITIGQDVEVKGINRNDVIIVGKVTMKDGSEINGVTIADFGIDVVDRASVKIENVKIKDANIGIETVGNGILKVKNSILYGNRKAMYLQQGKNVEIIDNEVYDNDEEGIDIRANVDGEIRGNLIHNNGESGIEVILGKSDLKIYDNKIKKNGSSGIAAQYYKEANKLGGVKIKDNTITGNKNYGIDCKVPSGGNPGVTYWTKSIQMTTNKVYNNKEGDFSDTCYFDDKKIVDAIKTKKQVEKEQKLKMKQNKSTQEILTMKEQEEQKKEMEKQKNAEEQKIVEQDILRKKLQEEKNLQTDLEELKKNIEELYNIDNISQEKIKNRPSIIVFFIGPNYRELRNMAEHITQYDTKIQESIGIKDDIVDEIIRKKAEEDIASMTQKKESIYNFIKRNNEEFSFFGWFFRKKI